MYLAQRSDFYRMRELALFDIISLGYFGTMKRFKSKYKYC